ncbi:uncharacterized protein [Amphiura filiformis]|uniref:uncharacterized protein n=1 Tax=Amphiura filiformis TaxID=82378 RepID=UPI003B21627F
MKILFILGLVAFATDFVHGITKSRKEDFSGDHETTLEGHLKLDLEEDKEWLFHVGLWGNNEQYINDEGVAAGFDIDVLNAVCRIAGKICKTVYDITTNCVYSADQEDPRGGIGMMAGWYEGCIGWRNTVERRLYFDFSDDYVQPTMEVFVTLPGNPGSFDYQDLTAKKIGFINGFSSNKQCVADLYGDSIVGADIPAENVVQCAGVSGCIQALESNEIDAWFILSSVVRGRTDVEIVSEELAPCTPVGNSLMARKDSRVLEWFQPALETLMSSSEYEELCQNIIDEHGDQPGRGPEGTCFKE